MKRREFILGSLSAGPLLMLPKWSHAQANPHFNNFFNTNSLDMSPLEHLSKFGGSSIIEGDMQDEAHEIFWNKDGYIAKKGGIPKVSEEFDVVIVGGGLSGLSAAYQLKGKKTLIIEGHQRLGGNAKSQVFSRSYAAQGSAYITLPEEGGEIDKFLTKLNLKKSFRKTDHDDETIIMNGKFVPGFWSGATDPKRADEFRAVHEKLSSIYENNYPEIPVWDNSTSARNYFNSLDSISFANWIKRELGELHPHIHEYITLYCWSSFSASPDELSAAQALNFLTCDLAGIQVLPGGNGMISEALYQDLKKRSEVKLSNLSFAVDIRSEGGKAIICYKDSANNLKTVRARQCIVTSPKMVCKKVITGLREQQFKAMNNVNYRAYLVANIFLKKKIPSKGYDLFSLDGVNPTNNYEDSKKRTFADVVFADWALKDAAEKSILTLYLPLPYDMAQQYLFLPNLHEKYVDRVKARLIPVLSNMGMSWSDVEGMRLVRYGHSMPVAEVGGVSNRIFEEASASIDSCIHFANQDNWGNPCFETSFGSALAAVAKI